MTSYAGIGSRETPPEILHLMTRIAQKFASLGLVLRTGACTGADQAFMRGAPRDLTELYVPWQGYERYTGKLPSIHAFLAAEPHHPAWPKLKRTVQALHARNVEIVLGPELKTPVSFVLCWTKDAATTRTSSKTGGTGMAIRVAAAQGIRVHNLADPATRATFENWLAAA